MILETSHTDDLTQLANLIKCRNSVARMISELIGRPAEIGHIGEYIASKIFNITLTQSASNAGYDGYFNDGSLKGSTVNIKWYAQHAGLLDIAPNLPNYYLVLTGPKSVTMSSRGQVRSWSIKSVFLFNAPQLVNELKKLKINIGTATSIRQEFWESAEIYPNNHNKTLIVSDTQLKWLKLFAPDLVSG